MLIIPKRLILSIALSCAIIAAHCTPATSTTHFKVFDMSCGMPDNSVNAITEDADGFIWVGTWNGLVRLDGKKADVFQADAANPNSLSGNMIRALLSTGEGLFVGTDNGIDFYSRADGLFIHSVEKRATDTGYKPIQERISRIINSGGNIFAVSIDGDILHYQGRNYIDEAEHNVFVSLPRPVTRHYADITCYIDGMIMALSNEGVTVLSADGEREISHTPIYSRFDTNMNIYYDHTSKRAYIGAGIGSAGVAMIVTDKKGTLRPDPDTIVPAGLMCATRVGNTLCFASDGGGLFVSTFNGLNDLHYTPGNSSIPGDALYTVFIDSNNNIWCGSYRNGLFLLSASQNRFIVLNKESGAISYDIVTAVIPDADNIYLGLDGGGFDIYNKTTGMSQNINSGNSSLPGNNVTSLILDGNMLWITIYSCGLTAYDLNSHKATLYTLDQNLEPGNKVWTLADDHRGNIYVGGRSLQIFNKKTRTFRLIEGCNELMVMSIVDGGKYMYVATRFAGVLKIDKLSTKVIARYSNSPTQHGLMLPGRSADFLFVDTHGDVYFTLASEGFFCIKHDNEGKESITKYGAKNGLNDARVNAMAEDAAGSLFVGTANGLYRYNKSTDTFTRISGSHLPTDYNCNAATCYNDELYFGSTQGVLCFNSQSMTEPTIGRSTIFTSLNIISHPGNKHINLCGLTSGIIELAHDENFFTVDFTVPEMSNPDELQFTYKLDGFDTEWRDAGNARRASYTNVPPGVYSLLVRHTMPDGSWSDVATLKIRIKRPWYSTLWAMLLWIALISVIAYIGLRFWRKMMLSNEQARIATLEKESERRLNDAKIDFYTNITHELRTPCFLIAAQIEELLDSQRHSFPVNCLHGIYRNATKLNKLISHIIDFRKIDSGHIKLSTRKIDLKQFLASLTPDYANLCHQKEIEFTYDHPSQPISADVDPDKLELIVTNLISNAFKYTGRGGKVSLSLSSQGDNVVIKVSDNGIGIVDKMQTAIFEPYFRTDRGEQQSSGDGLGLAFVKELVQLHSGSIEVQSEPNVGSTFIVTLPKSQPSATSNAAYATADYGIKRYTNDSGDANDTSIIVNNPTATHSILFVDASVEVVEILSNAFDYDFRVNRATDSAEGLRLALSGDYDVVVTDLMMPGLDGHALIKAIRAEKSLAHIKVVVFSAIYSEEEMLQAYNEGADAFYTKPMSLRLLKLHINKLLGITPDSPSAVYDIDSPAPTDTDTALDSAAAAAAPTSSYTREEQRFLIDCRKIIEQHLCNENFGAKFLAKQLAMSHSSLYKKIHRMTGMSIIEFINEYRICKAVNLFRQGNTNVQTVAETCGFRDAKTFRETFKRKMHIPPKQFITSISKK